MTNSTSTAINDKGYRMVRVVIHATIELAPEEHYQGLGTLDEQVRSDLEQDPASFFGDQIRDLDIESAVLLYGDENGG